VTTIFQQITLATVDGAQFYVWSDPNNWTAGVPTNGAIVDDNVSTLNPASYDDLSNLTLGQLNLTADDIIVAGTLTITSLVVTGIAGNQTLDANTYYNGGTPALLTIDAITGSGAYIEADGPNAVTVINGTDTGNFYGVTGTALLELNAAPNAASTFDYPSAVSDSGTFAFSQAGSAMAGSLQNVGIGDSIELPGTSVASVIYGASTLSVTTNIGTSTFSNVSYLPGEILTGHSAAIDPTTGLEDVTFTGTVPTDFLQTVAYSVTYNSLHFDLFTWSNANNWDNGVPADGGYVTIDVSGGASPQSYDDIADISLAALNLIAGSVAVGRVFESASGATLEVGSLSFGPSSASIFSDTEIGAPTATLTIDGFTGSNSGTIGAFGAHAFTEIAATADPGENYQVDQGGELLLDPTPNSSPGTTGEVFTFENTGTPSGIFAFQNPGGTIGAPLVGVEDGDTIALPGDQVDAVTYGTSSITIVTNLATTTFDNVDYNALPSGWTGQPDAVAGLVDATFGNSNPVTQFKQTQAVYEYGGTSNDFGIYLWSTLANWTNGIATDGSSITVLAPAGGIPNSVDDINRALSSLDDIAGGIMVAATLDVGVLTFGTTLPLIYADTELIGNPTAALTINNIAGTNYGTIGAIGVGANAAVLTPTDIGETYQVGDSAELMLQPTPNSTPTNPLAEFDYLAPFMSQGIASGTFAFVSPGSTIGALLADAEIGNSVALPGTFASSVIYGPTTLTVVTNVGTTYFDNVTYFPGDIFSGYVQSLDPVSGLVRVTFEGSAPNNFLQTTATGIGPEGGGEFLWSNANNWSQGVPLDDSVAMFDIPGSAAVPGGYDDIGNLVLDQLNIPTGYVAVGGALEILTVAASGNFSAGIEADTAIEGGDATITVDAFTNTSHMLIGATGIDAIARVNAPTDPGEIYQASDGGLVVLQPAPNASSQFDLNLGDTTGDTGTIAFQNPGSTVAALLANVGVGDGIELPGSSVSSVTFGADSLTVATNLGTTVFSDVTYLSSAVPGAPAPTGFTASTDATTGLEDITFTLCFCAGSLIRTPSGDVPVENLVTGDTVVTWRGEHRPITWIGVGRVLATRGRRTAATPLIVRKGALGDNVPNADLRVTKGHSLFIDEVLIPVEFLVNHRSILWDDRAQEVTIYHVELATHDVLIANGAPAESYRDDGNRWLFRNANDGWGREPQAPCAPVLTSGAIVDQAWRRVLDRSGPRPGLPLTDDPDLHLLVDGCRVDPTHADRTTYCFHRLPGERFREVRIMSRAAAPCELGLARDPRVLGVAVQRVTVVAGARHRVIEAADDRLCDGFHSYEPALDLRWTDGDAVLPADPFNGFDLATAMIVQIAGTAQYVATPKPRKVAA
jgi:Hint domain